MSNDLIVLGNNLPEPLSNNEMIELFKNYKNGSFTARDKLIHYNLRLVISIIFENYGNSNFEMQDLFSIGCEGLINAVDSFNLEKNIAFSTYATKCIHNKILLYFRRHKNDIQTVSIEKVINNNYDDEKTISYYLKSKDNIIEDYEDKELNMLIKNYISSLDERKQKVIKLYFGMFDGNKYSQREIAKKIGVSRTMVCNIIKNFLLDIRKMLKKANYLVIKNQINQINQNIRRK